MGSIFSTPFKYFNKENNQIIKQMKKVTEKNYSEETKLFENKQLNEIFQEIKKNVPYFVINSKNVKILKEPKDFLSTILKEISTAKKRIYLTSLYLGTGNNEKLIVFFLKIKKKKKR
jgi:CDP-diacylglycerol---glycerol-3-phosphate 3-phosphatidyltransferase